MEAKSTDSGSNFFSEKAILSHNKDMMRSIPIIVRIVTELAFVGFILEMVQASLGLVSFSTSS